MYFRLPITQGMTGSRKYILLAATILMIGSCKSKKKPSLSGQDPVEVGDFIEFFQPVKLSYTITDSIFKKKDRDSLLIAYEVFTQFVPDSILTPVFGKQAKVKVYPAGKVPVKDQGNYLFVKTVAGDKKAAYILYFNAKEQFIAGMPLLRSDKQNLTTQSMTLDRSYTITRISQRKNKDGSMSEGKDVYALNEAANNFMLIMTDALDDKLTELINPIDTFPRKHKFSGDYTTGKLNLVSIRDGRKTDRISFFIHFDKNNNLCTGEFKGEALIRSSTMAEYREGGDPCVLRFNFTSTSVTVKEIEGCGSRRGLRCTFNATYPKKKEPKPKATKKTTGKSK
jgi:hypothetical protein